ncbi:MAG: glycosyltransferase family 9 protein [Candidatus Binataceae bacterium]
MLSPPRRVLIILMGSIGDVVRALPLLGRIRRAWPDAHIAWAIEPKSKPIVDGHPWLDEMIVYERGRPWSFPLFLARIRSGRFDLALDLQRHLKSGVVSRMSGASRRFGFSRANAKELNYRFNNFHIEPQPPLKSKLTQYQAFGEAMGIPPAPIEFGLTPANAERSRALDMLSGRPRPILAVIMGSSWPSRIYFPEAIAAVIRNLAKPCGTVPRLFPVLLGAPDDIALANAITANLGDTPVLNLVGQTSLRDLVPIFVECAAAFGPDSGPMHIAAAAGCPIVSLWGSTSPERSAPWGFAEYSIKSDIPCHPCYLRLCPIGRECMRRIAPDDVAAMVRRALMESLSRSAAKGPRQGVA